MAEDTCKLANATKGMVILNLPHGLVPEHATMGVVGTRDHDVTTGVRTVVAHKRPISGSLTLLGKGTPGGGDVLEGLPRTVLRAPEVKQALARGAIKLVDDAPVETDKTAPAAAAPKATGAAKKE